MLLCTAIVAAIQPIAIRLRLRAPQTLTSLSDYTSSWNGLGASLMTLYHNLRVSARPLPVLVTALYFGAITGLQTATPVLFSFPLFNHSFSQPNPTHVNFLDFGKTGGMGDASDPSTPLGAVTQGNGFFWPDWYTAGAFMDTLSTGSNLSLATPGLRGNQLFDTVLGEAQPINGTALVNLTTFDVRCGQLPGEISSNYSFTEEGVTVINFSSEDDEMGFSLDMTDAIELAKSGSSWGVVWNFCKSSAPGLINIFAFDTCPYSHRAQMSTSASRRAKMP